MGTLSGGEAQRCKIIKYNNSSLSDLLYVLDKPSVGLHSHDIYRLSEAVVGLGDRGNTVLMVEHHWEMMEIADHIVDMGSGAGARGGEVLFEGSFDQLIAGDTLTGKLLRQTKELKEDLRTPKDWFSLALSLHNLKDVSVKLPKGLFTVIAGVGVREKVPSWRHLPASGGRSDPDQPEKHRCEPSLYPRHLSLGKKGRSWCWMNLPTVYTFNHHSL